MGVGNGIEPITGPVSLFHSMKYNEGNQNDYPIKRGAISFRLVTDGLSNTLMLGERSFDCSRAAWACSWGSYAAPHSHALPSLGGYPLGINSTKYIPWHPFPTDCVWLMDWTSYPYGLHSYHRQGVVCALADGAVAFLDENMDEQLVIDLAYMNNGAPAGGFNPN
jgi:hypothetical protein